MFDVCYINIFEIFIKYHFLYIKIEKLEKFHWQTIFFIATRKTAYNASILNQILNEKFIDQNFNENPLYLILSATFNLAEF